MILSASIMCANLGWLAREVIDLDAAGIDVFHIDIMDGEFVPNLALSRQDLAIVRSNTRKKIDVHLMVRKPSIYLPFVFDAGVDIVYVHFESGNALEHLRAIRSHGAVAGLAINPETSIDQILDVLPWVDRLLLMRVTPGFAGQQPLAHVEEKISRIIDLKADVLIGLDGAVSASVVAKWSKMGVDEFILGTSALFGKPQTYTELLNCLRMPEQKLPASPPQVRRIPTNFGMSWIPTFAFS